MRLSTFVLFAILLMTGCKDKTEIFKPVFRDISESVYASGVVKSAGQYQVMSLINGRISEVLVKSGDSVSIGQGLFRLESDVAEINADIALLNARNALLSSNYQKVEDAKIQITQLQKKYQLDSVQYARQNNLWSKGIGTKSELDFKELQLTQTTTALTSAKLQLSDLERQLKYNEAVASKNLKISRINQREYIVQSKITGRVFSILKEVGDVVTPQTPLAIAGSSNEYIIELAVDENDIVRVQFDQPVFLKMDSYKNKVFEAKIYSIDPIMDERTRTFKVTAVFTKTPPVLYPNLSAECNIVITTKHHVLTLPRSVIVGDTAVVLKNGELRNVKLGIMDYNLAEITDGLDGTEEIVTYRR